MNHCLSVLIADDDLEIREILTAIVRNTIPTAIVVSVENGREALDYFRRQGADLVISNFIMPEMNGPTLVEFLRSEGENVPIIMVSGSPEAEVQGREAGIDRFVNKQDVVALLPDEIRSLMGLERVSYMDSCPEN